MIFAWNIRQPKIQCPIPMIPGFIWVHRTAIEVLIPQSRMSWPPLWSMSPSSSCVAAEPADGFGTRKLRGLTQNLMVCHICHLPQPIFTQAAMDSPRCCFRKNCGSGVQPFWPKKVWRADPKSNDSANGLIVLNHAMDEELDIFLCILRWRLLKSPLWL